MYCDISVFAIDKPHMDAKKFGWMLIKTPFLVSEQLNENGDVREVWQLSQTRLISFELKTFTWYNNRWLVTVELRWYRLDILIINSQIMHVYLSEWVSFEWP